MTTLADGTGPFFRTGALGYFSGDELVVAGRLKDMLIVRGCNHYPQDIEQAVWEVPDVRTGSVIAFSVPGDRGEAHDVLPLFRRRARRAVARRLPR